MKNFYICARFTLVEILAVITIIAVLTGLVFPAVSKVRNKARLTECGSNLKQLGIAFAAYTAENEDMFPVAAMMPSVNSSSPPICEVLLSYMGDNEFAFRCPADVKPESYYSSSNASDKTFFDTEGCSYEYASMIGGSKVGATNRGPGGMSSAKRIVMFDYECFHRSSSVYSVSQDDSGSDSLSVAGKGSAKNYLFADWHVSDKF